MKKIILSVLMLGVMLMAVGMVSADVDFTAPEDGDSATDSIFISWENGDYATSNLMYAKETCAGLLPGTIILSDITSEGEHTWDVSDLDDGDYCIKIAKGITLHNEVQITIDNTAPIITFTSEIPYYVVKDTSITIEAEIEDEALGATGIVNFGDGSGNKVVDIVADVISKSHIYDESGEYIVTVTVTDEAGNEGTGTTIVLVRDEEPEWIIPLYADDVMNMFSIPLIPESTDINDVLPEEISDNAKKIWAYQEGGWKYNEPEGDRWDDSSARIQIIEPGYGYIIFMNDDAVAYGDGKELGQDVPPEVTLTNGWNLIGHYGENPNVKVKDAFSSLNLGDDNYWNSVLAVDDDGNFESIKDNDFLVPTETYWLSIKSINLEENELRYFTYFPAQEAY